MAQQPSVPAPSDPSVLDPMERPLEPRERSVAGLKAYLKVHYPGHTLVPYGAWTITTEEYQAQRKKIDDKTGRANLLETTLRIQDDTLYDIYTFRRRMQYLIFAPAGVKLTGPMVQRILQTQP